VGRNYVGIDLHKRRSVIVKVDEAGEKVSTVRINNSHAALAAAVGDSAECPEVILEATAGWYWAADVLAEEGHTVRLASPHGLNWGHRRVKNDERDATDLADMARLGRLPEAWLAPPPVRELRELVRYRARLVQLRAGLKSQIHGVLTKEGITETRRHLWGPKAEDSFAGLGLSGVYGRKVDSLRRLLAAYDVEISAANAEVEEWLGGDVGYHAIRQIIGVGPILAGVFVAEIGDVSRFSGPDRLCCWAGLTPRHHESDTKVIRGRISKQGSRLVRWAAVEAISRQRDPAFAELYRRVAERRGTNIARVAAARKLLSLVYYGLRDGEIRCLANRG
jgi:transposase